MVIDAHTHIDFKPSGGDARAVKSLLTSMDRAGIGLSLVLASPNDDCLTDRLLRAIEPYPDRLRAIGTVSPLERSPTPATVRSWLRRGLILGLKFYTGYEHFYPADKALRPYLKLLVEYGRPAMFHCGDTLRGHPRAKLKYAQPLAVDDLAIEMPELRVVMAHVGWPWVTDAAEVCFKNPNVFTDCSGFVYGRFDAQRQREFRRMIADFVRVTGSTEQMMFGTDWPIAEQDSYLEAARKVWSADSPVFGATAVKLFGIDRF